MPNGSFRVPGRFLGTVAFLALSLSLSISNHARAQTASIGIYDDVSRSSCSLSDAGPGLIRAYVLVNTQSGFTGVRFSAPKPDCFNATWMADEVPPAYVYIGDSQSDISIATGLCTQGLTHVLTMVFQKTSSTAPCCEFQVQSAIGQADILYADCSFFEHPVAATSGYVNSDATCPCGEGLDLPPSVPTNAAPTPGTTNLSVELQLSWQSSDPEQQPLVYDVYLGEAADPPLLIADLAQPYYDVGPLSYQTLYHWKVVAKDPAHHTTEGPVWTFNTGAPVVPPTPINPSPSNGVVNQYRAVNLTWQVGGTGVVLSYDVYFGTTPTPPLVGNLTAVWNPSFAVDSLALDTTYYWRVVTRGEGGQTSSGSLWSFHTVVTNPPPNAPSSPAPQDHAIGRPLDLTLTWSSQDPEGQALAFNVYFGTDPAPPFLAHTTSKLRQVSSLTVDTDYYWRVVAIDAEGDSTSGPVWTFLTRGLSTPTVPQLVAPTEGSTISPRLAYLAWTSTDPEGGPLTFDIYLGTSPSPVMIQSGYKFTNMTLVITLDQNATYYWKVVAHDQDGLTTEGPLWSFKTRALVPPVEPFNPSPASGAVNVPRLPTLTWDCSDPDGQPLVYGVSIGTYPGGGSTYPASGKSLTLPSALGPGVMYYWRVTAYDTDQNSTSGPWWTFTTNPSNLPPAIPSDPYPAYAAEAQATLITLQWTSSDPENLPLRYDLYFGTTNPPPLKASSLASPSYGLNTLPTSTKYYWIVVAHDVDGNYRTGPTWKFTTGGARKLAMGLYSDASGSSCVLSDKGNGMRTVYVVLDGPTTYTGARFVAPTPACFHATWLYDSTPYVTIGNSQSDVSVGFGLCLQPPVTVMSMTYLSTGTTQGCCSFSLQGSPFIGHLLVTDCSFAEIEPMNEPVLGISSDDACPACDTGGVLNFAQAEDTCRAGAQHLVTVDLMLDPAMTTDAGGVDVVASPSLDFISCERGDLTQGWPVFTSLENNNVITIAGSGAPIPAGVKGVFARLTFATDCCTWPAPAELGLTNAADDLTPNRLVGTHLSCRYPPSGDVNNDGNITVADAQCALEAYLYAPLEPPSGCGGTGAAMRGDVDCSSATTPGDAYCIFRHWLDQSCSFCTGGSVLTRAVAVAPHLALRALQEGDDIVVVLSANGAGTVGALGLELTYPDGLEMLRVEPPRKDAFAALQTRMIEPGRVRIGAYSNAGKALSADGDLLAIRFHAGSGNPRGTVTAREFVDDLAGATSVSVTLEALAQAQLPNQVVLHQNSPNPFNPQTTIRFELPAPMRVRLTIFDVNGRLVKQLLDEHRSTGVSMVDWNGTDGRGANVATGVYFYVLDAGGSRYQHKMVLLK